MSLFRDVRILTVLGVNGLNVHKCTHTDTEEVAEFHIWVRMRLNRWEGRLSVRPASPPSPPELAQVLGSAFDFHGTPAGVQRTWGRGYSS